MHLLELWKHLQWHYIMSVEYAENRIVKCVYFAIDPQIDIDYTRTHHKECYYPHLPVITLIVF